MTAGNRSRYAGAQPFTDDPLSRELFHGRKPETTILTHRILANRLTVLFARSGLGKTSLLNAGIAELLRGECLAPLSVRVWEAGLDPVEAVYRGIENACRRQDFEYVAGDRQSMWHFFKTAQFWRGDILLTPVLILDQFEELFTLQPPRERSRFLDEFSCVARGVRPAREEDPKRPDLSDTAPAIKILLSLREDFLAHLEEMSDRIPGILDQRFRLLPLTRSAASEAILLPASVEHGDLAMPPFDVDPWAQNMVLNFLTASPRSACGSATHVEPFQLQLICRHIEDSARRKQRQGGSERVVIGSTDLGGERKLHRILKNFYYEQIRAIPSVPQRFKARRLCGQFLITSLGRRLRLEETEIRRLTGVRPATLETLVNRRLLRVDQSADGNYYELSHDSLVLPVMESRQWWFASRAVAVLGLGLSVLLIVFYATALFMQAIDDLLEHPLVAVVAMVVLVIAARVSIRNLREFWDMARRIWIAKRTPQRDRVSPHASPAK
jgi:hypothetical protein